MIRWFKAPFLIPYLRTWKCIKIVLNSSALKVGLHSGDPCSVVSPIRMCNHTLWGVENTTRNITIFPHFFINVWVTLTLPLAIFYNILCSCLVTSINVNDVTQYPNLQINPHGYHLNCYISNRYQISRAYTSWVDLLLKYLMELYCWQSTW